MPTISRSFAGRRAGYLCAIPVLLLASCGPQADRGAEAPVLVTVGDVWIPRTPMPTGRNAVGAAVIDGKMYVVGGWTSAGPSNAVEVYDPVADTWAVRAPMPTPRNGFGIAVADGKIYAVGGWNTWFLDVVEAYDPVADSWSVKAPMPAVRSQVGAAAFGGRIYAIGGYEPAGASARVEEYDPATDTWRARQSAPTAQASIAAIAVDRRILAIAGSTVEEYDPAKDTWKTRGPMPPPTPRYWFGAALLNGKIYVSGGVDNSYVFGINAWYDANHEYDPRADTWTPRASLPTNLGFPGAAAANDRVYAVGGSSTSLPGMFLDWVWEYQPPSQVNVPPEGGSCHRWQTCTPENPCHTGWVTGCKAGVPVCTDIGGWLSNGTSCGQDQVCYLGECQPCAAGSGCTPAEGPCHLGAISCSTGLPVCQDAGLAPGGTSCGPDQVCYQGFCNWCASGWECTPWDTCTTWRTDCSSGMQQCLPTTEQRPDGSWCGPDRYCQAGVCDFCYWGQACPLADPCHVGYTDCSSGRAVCFDYGWWQPDGTPCGDGNVCQQGVCLPPGCTPGADCTPPGQCFAWTVDCSSGAASCNQTSTPLPNGTACGDGLACMTGQCVPAREVRGTAAYTYWTSDGPVGVVSRGIFLARALVPDGSGGHATFEGQIQGSSFVIPGVPQGTYLLNVQVQGRGPDLIETSASDVDLGADWMGRPDAVIPSLPTPVTFDVDGLVPWNAQDRLELVSAGAGDFFPVFGQPPVTSVPAGSTRAAQVFDFQARAQRLIDPALGDEALVVQSASLPLPGTDYLYQAASGAAPMPGFAVLDGVAQTAYLMLEPIAEKGELRADWRIGEFERQVAAMSPAAVPVSHRLTVTDAPFAGTTPSPLFQGSFPETRNPTLFFLTVPAGAPDLAVPGLAYGRGFLPPSFVEIRATTFRARLEFTAPGATPSTTSLTMNRAELAAGAPEVVVPALTPALQPRLNGVLDAFQPQGGVGETPTLSWTAPEVGVPTSYQVAIYRLGTSSNGASALFWEVMFFTTGTSFQLPAGFLSPGNSYVATILAREIPGESLAVPYRQTWVLSNANLMTAPFRPDP